MFRVCVCFVLVLVSRVWFRVSLGSVLSFMFLFLLVSIAVLVFVVVPMFVFPLFVVVFVLVVVVRFGLVLI